MAVDPPCETRPGGPLFAPAFKGWVPPRLRRVINFAHRHCTPLGALRVRQRPFDPLAHFFHVSDGAPGHGGFVLDWYLGSADWFRLGTGLDAYWIGILMTIEGGRLLTWAFPLL